jgi:lipoprotein-releasing system permease protein
MPFTWFLALRFFRDGRTQTALIVAGVAVGVAVQVFITALIAGLQRDLIDKTLGSLPHVTLEPRDEIARPLLRDDPHAGFFVGREVQRPSQRLRSIDDWLASAERSARLPEVTVVSPRAAGPALARRGNATATVLVQGVKPEEFTRVVPIKAHVVEGAYRIGGEDAVMGDELAEELGVEVGDTVRVTSSEGNDARFIVRGIFDLGGPTSDSQWIVVPLRSAQSLFRIPGGATHLDVKVHDVFAADEIADRLARRTGLSAESWMDKNAQLLAALTAQTMSTTLIRVFVLISVAMGIASVLVVSVVQKQGQIGILRAIGTSRRAVVQIYLFQGALMGLSGAILGSGLGVALIAAFQEGMGLVEEAWFRIEYEAWIFVGAAALAVATGIAAAALPSLRAARLDPAEAIHHG